MENNEIIEKGQQGGKCNRSACNNDNAIYYNHSTRKYYCHDCAMLINRVNYYDSMRLFGHELCTLINQKEVNNGK